MTGVWIGEVKHNVKWNATATTTILNINNNENRNNNNKDSSDISNNSRNSGIQTINSNKNWENGPLTRKKNYVKKEAKKEANRVPNNKEDAKGFEVRPDGSRVYHFDAVNTKNTSNNGQVSILDYPRLIFNRTKMPGKVTAWLASRGRICICNKLSTIQLS